MQVDAEKLAEVCQGDETVKRYVLGDTESGGDGADRKGRIADRFESYAKICDTTFKTKFMRWTVDGEQEDQPDRMFFTLYGVKEPSPPIDVGL